MAATDQQFCTDCHDGMKSRLPDTKIADAADFGTSHPQFMPAVITNAAPEKPVFQRIAWTPTARGIRRAQVHPCAASFEHQRGRADGPAPRQGVCPEQGSSIARIATRPIRAARGSSRSRWRKPARPATRLTFDQIGGTFRTLRHGEPEQVVADLRCVLSRAVRRRVRPTCRPGAPSAGRRQRCSRLAADYARAVRFYPTQAEPGDYACGLQQGRRVLRLPHDHSGRRGDRRLQDPERRADPALSTRRAGSRMTSTPSSIASTAT